MALTILAFGVPRETENELIILFQKKYVKKKKRRIRTWDLQHTDLTPYAHDHMEFLQTLFINAVYNSHKKS